MGKNKRKRSVQNKSEVLMTKKMCVLKNLQTVNKSNGMLVGTNSVLRSLEKRQLSAVLISSDSTCVPIFRAISFWCKETGVPLFTLDAEERCFLNLEIPVSITYGIKKDFIHLHPQLEESLKQFRGPKTEEISDFKSIEKSDAMKSISPKVVPIEKVEETFACHKKHASKTKKPKVKLMVQEDFLSLCSSSDSDDFNSSKCHLNDSEFPDYKSEKWKDTDLIIK